MDGSYPKDKQRHYQAGYVVTYMVDVIKCS